MVSSIEGIVELQLVPVGRLMPMLVWATCNPWSISGSMNGKILATRVARLIDSLKLAV